MVLENFFIFRTYFWALCSDHFRWTNTFLETPVFTSICPGGGGGTKFNFFLALCSDVSTCMFLRYFKCSETFFLVIPITREHIGQITANLLSLWVSCTCFDNWAAVPNVLVQYSHRWTVLYKRKKKSKNVWNYE